MTEQLTQQPVEAPENQTDGDSLLEPFWTRVGSAVRSITYALTKTMTPGDVADLRRLRPEEPSAPAFWKLVAAVLEPAHLVCHHDEERDEDERRWAAVITATVLLGRFVQPGRRLGEALAAAEVAELRVVRLLRARGEGLRFELRRTAQILAAKGQSVDPIDLARLVLSDGHEHDEENVRRQLAREYYRHL